MFVIWKQPFLLSAGSRKPFNLLMCNCAAFWARAPHWVRVVDVERIPYPAAGTVFSSWHVFFPTNFWPEFNSGKRVKSKVVLSFRERAQWRKTKAQSAHRLTHTHTRTQRGVESCAWKAATFIYFAATSLKDLGTCRCFMPTVLSIYPTVRLSVGPSHCQLFAYKVLSAEF